MNYFYRNSMAIFFSMFLIAFSQISYAQDKGGQNSISKPDSIRIDKIEISKNWITWDLIIKNELLFEEGDWVRFGEIDTSMNKIWNIDNFADVKYEIVEGPEGNTLKIIALDAVKFYPLFTIDHSSENDYKYRLGAGDDNFLGSNTKLKIAWEKTPNAVKWDFSVGLPRQLLYKNMTTRLGFAKGNETKLFLERMVSETDGVRTAEYNTLMLAPYNKTELYLEIGNPWHLDYQYRFSPDLSLILLNHEIDHDLLSEEDLALGVEVPLKNYHFLDIQVSESIGTVNKKRHRKDGYTAKLSYDLNLGFKNTASFNEFNAEGEYHKTVTDLLQLSFWTKTGYTTADDQYKFIKGSSDVLGLRTGEIFGKAYYSAYAGSHFTWLNTKWISLENAYFVNLGNGADTFPGLFNTKTKVAMGSYLEIRFPIAPIAVFRFSFMYAGPGSEWFKFNIE
jgi:outer membrane protein assembly factor BamA